MAWFDSQLNLDPEKLVFIDETWTTTNMARKNGRASQRRASARRRSTRSLEDDDLRRRSTPDRHDGADGSRPPDQRPMLSGLCR